jgi:hypothetical protein
MFVRSRVIPPLGLALSVGLAVVALAGCGDIDAGSQPFAGTVQYKDPAGEYELRMLEPPWFPVVLPTETLFVVPPDNVTISVTSQESDALYSLHVIPVDGDAASAMMAAATAATPPWNLANMRTVRAVSGVSGSELSWQEGSSAFHREAFLGGSTVRTFHLHFTAKKAIANDAMITQMILSFTPRGATAVIR